MRTQRAIDVLPKRKLEAHGSKHYFSRCVNGQPPPLPARPPAYRASQGIGCFAKGCLTLLIVGFILIAGVIGGTWYLYVKTVNNLTSPAPADVQVEPPSERQFQTAENSMDRLRTAIAGNKETTVEFTAADLNALFARDPEFSDWRGRVRIKIADSTMTIALSAPLSFIPLPKMKKRWFNGTARFSFTYESGTFSFDIKSAEAGGHHVPDIFLSSSSISSFNESMNRSFRNTLDGNDRGSEFWNHVKKMSLEGDKLVVTTKAD
jgi:hypothetical protein